MSNIKIINGNDKILDDRTIEELHEVVKYTVEYPVLDKPRRQDTKYKFTNRSKSKYKTRGQMIWPSDIDYIWEESCGVKEKRIRVNKDMMRLPVTNDYSDTYSKYIQSIKWVK